MKIIETKVILFPQDKPIFNQAEFEACSVGITGIDDVLWHLSDSGQYSAERIFNEDGLSCTQIETFLSQSVYDMFKEFRLKNAAKYSSVLNWKLARDPKIIFVQD